MASYFCLTVRFLQPYFHGRADGGEPEWPPSPLRMFQALVAAAGNHWRDQEFDSKAVPALNWLERQGNPSIVAPVGHRAESKYRLYVPDNVADKVAKSWAGGREANIADYRTEKDVRPIRFTDFGEVHYLFPLPGDECLHFEVLNQAARSVTHLGWGVDMATGNATILSKEEADRLEGERWLNASGNSGANLRVPIIGTLSDLRQKHAAFLERLSNDRFNPVPPLSAFRVVSYRRAFDVAPKTFAAFSILKPDASGFRPFSTPRRGIAVSGMLRFAAKNAAEAAGWESSKISQFVLGHGEIPTENQHTPVDGPRFAYIPLPTIHHRPDVKGDVVGDIRRALLVVSGDAGRGEIDWASRTLSGADLIDKDTHQPAALLSMLPRNDKQVLRYTRPSATWSTVTPVVLPGYDDARKYRQRLSGKSSGGGHVNAIEQKELLAKLDKRIDFLLRKSIRQAGLPEQLAEHAQIEYRSGGFLPGCELATRYAFPEQFRRFRRLHVRIRWRNAEGNAIEVPGPLCLGRGRFVGLGLFAATEE